MIQIAFYKNVNFVYYQKWYNLHYEMSFQLVKL